MRHRHRTPDTKRCRRDAGALLARVAGHRVRRECPQPERIHSSGIEIRSASLCLAHVLIGEPASASPERTLAPPFGLQSRDLGRDLTRDLGSPGGYRGGVL